MTNRKLYAIRIPEDLMNSIKALAAKKKIGYTAYLTEVLQNHIDQNGQHATPQKDSSVTSLCLSRETKKAFMKKARPTGMSADEYIRYLLEPKQKFELKIVVNDLQELNTCFRDLVTTINAVAKVMLQTNTAFEVQVERITCLLEEIHELFSKTYFLEREQRNDLLEKAYRSINEEIVRYRESEKRAFRRKRQTEDSKDASRKDQGLPQQ